jgi:peroxiredoxin
MKLPHIPLQSTLGGDVNLAELHGTVVIYLYPMTGQPGKALPEDWDEIPGARGCTPQSCSFRDHMAELRQVGADHVFGISTQGKAWQTEAAERLHLPFALLSDEHLKLQKALDLPVFEAEIEGEHPVLLKRLALIADDGVIGKVFYPVFPPEQNAVDVLDWLRTR